MHPCLSVDEILRLIACELVASRGRKTAVALACCCKSFEDPALDALWGEWQMRLLPLLKTLPGDVWNQDGYNSFKRLPTKPEWARFRKYARRIRRLYEYVDRSSLPLQVLSVLQFHVFSEPLFPNLETLLLFSATGEFVPFIPLFLSPRTTLVNFTFSTPDFPKAVVASMITTLPTLCPNLQNIGLHSLPRDPIITAAVSELLLTTNRNTLRSFNANSPLTEDAREVIYGLPDLCELRVVIVGSTSLPTVVLPNLTRIDVEFSHGHDWLQGFRGASLGKLASVTFRSESDPIGNFLETFENVTLTTSASATLSTFTFYTSRPWRPNYRSLLPFTQLEELVIEFSCERGCSSTIDDDTITDLARVMPKLEVLCLGKVPCQTSAGVTAKGLAALACHCLHLHTLRIHFQVASLDPPEIPRFTSVDSSTLPRGDCALEYLEVGNICIPEESTLMVALTLLRIFPRLCNIDYIDGGWEKVAHAIEFSKRLVDHSRPGAVLESTIRS